MSQNLAIQAGKTPTGTFAPLNLDAAGNLLIADAAAEGGTAVSNSSGDVAAASAVATLAAAVGKTTYIAGLIISGMGATGAGPALATLAGIIGGTATIVVPVPAGATLGIAPIVVQFDPPLPASAVNTAIVLTLPTLGAGNLHAAVSAWGFQK